MAAADEKKSHNTDPNTGQQETNKHNPDEQANVPITISQVKATNPWGHSTIQIGTDKPVGLVPNSHKQAAAAAATQAEIATGTGVLPSVSVPGHIETSSDKVIKNTTIYVTTDQANAMRTYISEASSSTQRYDFIYHNCTEFTESVLGAGGVNAPRDLTPGGLVDDLRK